MSTSVIGCVLIPHFALRAAMIAPNLDGLPLILGPPEGERAQVIDSSPEAAARGVRPGMSVREAVALVPEILTVTRNPVRETELMAEMLTNLEQFSPRVEAAVPGRCYVDLSGSSRWLGPPATAAERLLSAVDPLLRPRVGVAPGKFAAWVAARASRAGGFRVVEPGNVAALLADAPVSWLPLSTEIPPLLERLGVTTLKELAALPASAVAARFGPSGERAWRLAAGQGDLEDRTVRAVARDSIFTEHLELPAPVTSRDALFVALRHLVERLFRRPELHGRSVRQARVRAHLDGGSSWERTLNQRDPVDADRLADGMRLRLESVTIPGVIAGLSLEVTGVTTAVARQYQLLAEHRPRQAPSLLEAVRQLRQRYGHSPVFRVVEVEGWSRIPERRHALTSYDP